MLGGGEERGEVNFQERQMPKTGCFKHLGSTVQENSNSETEVTRRVITGCFNWRKLTGVLCTVIGKSHTCRVKGKVYRMVMRPAMIDVRHGNGGSD